MELEVGGGLPQMVSSPGHRPLGLHLASFHTLEPRLVYSWVRLFIPLSPPAATPWTTSAWATRRSYPSNLVHTKRSLPGASTRRGWVLLRHLQALLGLRAVSGRRPRTPAAGRHSGGRGPVGGPTPKPPAGGQEPRGEPQKRAPHLSEASNSRLAFGSSPKKSPGLTLAPTGCKATRGAGAAGYCKEQ